MLACKRFTSFVNLAHKMEQSAHNVKQPVDAQAVMKKLNDRQQFHSRLIICKPFESFTLLNTYVFVVVFSKTIY